MLGRLVADGILGVTANPTIFARAIEGSDAYDQQFAALIAQGRSVLDAYWDLVTDDIGDALEVLGPTFDASAGSDGFVSVEVAPAGPRHRGHHRRRPPAAPADRPAEPVGEDPGHRRGRARHPGDDRRGPQHQHHADLLGGPLRRGDRRLPRRAGDPRRGRRRPGVGAQRGLVLRQPGRHRGRPSPGRRRQQRRAGAARPGRGRPGQAGLPAVR